MTQVFLAQAAHVLLVLHALAAIAATAAATHNAVLSWRGIRGRSVPWRLVRLYVRVLLVAQCLTLLLGFGIYPAFRVFVRAAWMDHSMPAATGFFEIKEHWSTLATIGIAYLYFAARQVTRATAADRISGAYHAVSIGVAIALWFAALTGLALVPLRSV